MMTPCDSLADVRSAIDQIDAMLVGLLAERGRYVQEAARFKRNAADVAAPDRVRQVMDKVLAHADATGASPAVVQAVYQAMVPVFVAEEQAKHRALAA
jgi:isochorismate pyruvate lyase